MSWLNQLSTWLRHYEDVMTKGEVERAVRDATHRLDEWQETTGALTGSYRYEVEGIVQDAVHIGIRAALGLPYVGLRMRT